MVAAPLDVRYNKIRQATKGLGQYALQVALPSEVNCTRIPLMCSEEPTSINRIRDMQQINFGSLSDSTTKQLESGRELFFLFTHPLRAWIHYQRNPGKHARYAAYFEYNGVMGTNDVGPTITGTITTGVSWCLRPLFLMTQALDISGHATWSPHGDRLYCLGSEDRRYFWVDATATAPATISISSTTSDFEAQLLDMDGMHADRRKASVSTYYTAPSGPSYVNFVVSASGYYGVIVTTKTTDEQFGLAFETSADSFCHHPLPYIEEHVSRMQKFRNLGCSMLISNVAQVLTKCGTIYARQYSIETPWYRHIPNTDLITDSGRVTTLGATDGAYGFMKFENPINDLNFTTLSVNSSSGIPDSYYVDINTQRGYLVFNLQVEVNDQIAAGASFHVIPHWIIENVNNDQWMPSALALGNHNQFLAEMKQIEKIAQFYENPVHVAQIMQGLRSAGKFALIHAPALLSALSAAFPQYSEYLTSAAHIARILQS